HIHITHNSVLVSGVKIYKDHTFLGIATHTYYTQLYSCVVCEDLLESHISKNSHTHITHNSVLVSERGDLSKSHISKNSHTHITQLCSCIRGKELLKAHISKKSHPYITHNSLLVSGGRFVLITHLQE
ncbi:unnamed protein product, partial [Owenia fusiformis]